MAGHHTPRGPGKTAPRLINDLLDYDLRYQAKKEGRHLLADNAPQHRDPPHPPLPPRKGDYDCRHTLMLKPDQTSGPSSDGHFPDEETRWTISTYCSDCRHYFDILVDYSQWKENSVPCRLSDHDNPLHHLQHLGSKYAENLSELVRQNKYKPDAESHYYVCSGELCPLRVEIRITLPRLTENFLKLILNASKVKARGTREIQLEPERYDNLQHLVPLQVLGYLRQYIIDAQGAKGVAEGRRIAKRNKKYMLAFGEECEPLFEYLDFTSIEDESSEGKDPEQFWRLPRITDANREFLKDVDIELQVKIMQRPQSEQQITNNRLQFLPQAALPLIVRSLQYTDYPTTVRSRTKPVNLDTLEHPYYASLGVVEDFSDDLLSWAYDRQCQCDPKNKPYYLDCLSGIAKGRSSEDLQTKAVMAESAGEYGQQAIEDAYKFFGLDEKTKEGDDHIMGLYKSRVESAPRQKDEARKCLLIIGKARNSGKIETLANDRSMSYEEAMEFLQVSDEVTSDLIESAAVAMASEGDVSKAARAMRVIATKRGDYNLQQAATFMESGTTRIPIDQAYTRLQIHDHMLPEETIFVYFQQLTKDNGAGTRDHYAEALRSIALERGSNYLLAKLDDPDAVVAPAPSTSDQPIGLDNIGNTCYLNSLLQYYYTIKTIRHVVMNFQDYRMPLGEEDIKRKRVGGQNVSKGEIIEAQKFIGELRNLFENLRTASTRSIKPTRDLAESTIFSSAVVANFRRASISSPNGARGLAAPVYGPEPRPVSEIIHPTPPAGTDIEMIDQPGDKGLENSSVSSEATLVDSDPLPTYNEATNGDMPSSPTTEKGDDDLNVIIDGKDSEGDAVMVNGENASTNDKIMPAPEKPPPVPPRKKSNLVIQTTETKDVTSEEDLWKLGSQQDVTEVIGNVMFRLQCAIKPTSIDEDGGQIDSIRDLFYCRIAEHLGKPQGLETKIGIHENIKIYPAPSGTRSIYEAMDAYFDEEFVEYDGGQVPKWTAIEKLPPILQFHIQRSVYDRSRGSFKNSNPVTFPETIYLDRYMDATNDSVVMHRRRETWEWKNKLRRLNARKISLEGQNSGVTVAEALTAAKDYANSLQNEPGLVEAIEERTAEVAHELESISQEIANLKQKLNEQFTDMHKYEYKLQTVFIHRGEAGGGHYWIYIYDFENDIWRKYNDDRVDVVTNRKEIFEPQKVVDGTPYYLAYVRSEDKQDLVQAVCRDVPEPMEVTDAWAGDLEDEGVVMEDNDDDGAAVRHVEHVKPRPLRPKPLPNQSVTNSWETDPGIARTDANGKPW